MESDKMVVLAVALRKPRIGAKAKGLASEQTRRIFHGIVNHKWLKNCDLRVRLWNCKEIVLRSFECHGNCAPTACEGLRQREKKVQNLQKLWQFALITTKI